MPSHHYKLVIAYDGTAYHGWQIQPNGITIQEVMQNILKQFLREEIHLTASGRTDAGVHAEGQVAHFSCERPIDTYRFMASSNGLLPPDIRVRSIEPVPSTFHAQYSALGKTYHYHLHLDRIPDPFKRHYALHVLKKIDQTLLEQGAKRFIGTHDFAAFANEAHEGTASYDSVRTIKRLDVVKEPGGVRLEFEADGFLYKMVRNIVGHLLEIAEGKRDVEDLEAIFASRDRRLAGKAVAPHGLFLMHVHYPKF